jgi:hypothetical protein
MAYKIKNWDEFQHFKDRTPPWIKLYRTLLDDPYWHELSADCAKTLTMLWLLASEDKKHLGYLPDIKTISFRLRISQDKMEKQLQQLNHWVVDDDINMISSRYQDDAPETETETYREETETRECFEEFWKSFPAQRKGNREKVEAAYRQALKRAKAEEIQAGLKSYIDSDEVKRGFAKGAAAWLNDDRWAHKYTSTVSEKPRMANVRQL